MCFFNVFYYKFEKISYGKNYLNDVINELNLIAIVFLKISQFLKEKGKNKIYQTMKKKKY